MIIKGNNMVKKYLLIAILPILYAFGCNQIPQETAMIEVQTTETQVSTQVQAIQTEEAYVFKTSQPGYFTIMGRLTVIDPMLMFPDLDDGLYLVSMDGQEGDLSTIPQFEKGTVPQAEVDETTGDFTFTNIEPGQYAVVVLTMNGEQVPARFYESESLAILTLEEGDESKKLDLGYLLFP